MTPSIPPPLLEDLESAAGWRRRFLSFFPSHFFSSLFFFFQAIKCKKHQEIITRSRLKNTKQPFRRAAARLLVAVVYYIWYAYIRTEIIYYYIFILVLCLSLFSTYAPGNIKMTLCVQKYSVEWKNFSWNDKFWDNWFLIFTKTIYLYHRQIAIIAIFLPEIKLDQIY